MLLFFPSAANVCETLRKLTSSNTLWTFNASYQTLFDKVKSLIKDDVCMKFYNETKPMYLDTKVSGIGLVTSLLQTRDGATWPRNITPDNTILRLIVFASKSLTSTK